VQRFIGGVFGLVFLGIGLVVIGSLWTAPFGAFGSPPLVSRLFGTLIAVAFVAMGGGIAVASFLGRQTGNAAGSTASSSPPPASPSPSSSAYLCSKCGAPLADKVDVSPHGDVKCTYCGAWFNIHQR
jgi:DNA-directed RNA polymerase subunit RPC12/RpoP